MGKTVTVSFPPRKIISLVPSQTELLADLGLNSEIVAITKFCVHPESWRKSKRVIGGTKKFNFETIHSLQPDLIIGNKEENYPEGIAELQSRYPVWMSDIKTFENALDMILSLGRITGKEAEANGLVSQIGKAFEGITPLKNQSALYLIWRKPWMGAAAGTFIHEMLTRSGLSNCLALQVRYPELTEEDIKQHKPDLVLLSSEPYPFREKHIQEIKKLLPDSKIVLVDGEMFSWYGSRMLRFPAYLSTLRSQLA